MSLVDSYADMPHFLAMRTKEVKKKDCSVAEEIGVSSPMFNRLKNGHDAVPLERLPDLAKALNVPADELFVLCMKQKLSESCFSTLSEAGAF